MTMAAHLTPPPQAPAVPPRQEVPLFPPIRPGGGGRHRLRQAVRHRPGMLVAGLLAAAAALSAGPLRLGPPPPATIAPVVGQNNAAHCPGGPASPG
ncbi:hypothetical protein OG871_22195 [Kitasatospora sp. NBC_00374]|uniref:hypothetical protein n=1 Tax=Kitasatospora sp. NBC_00374 TaxID=2975964 RepID=UPI0032497444